MSSYGTLIDSNTLRFERLLPGSLDRVWRYITESESRAKWLASGSMELREGGKVELCFNNSELSSRKENPPEKYKCADGGMLHGKVIECDPPHLLSHSWGEGEASSQVTYELTQQGDKVLLVLTHRKLRDHKQLISVAAGWHVHTDMLIAHLSQQPLPPFWSTHAKLEAEYEKRLPENKAA